MVNTGDLDGRARVGAPPVRRREVAGLGVGEPELGVSRGARRGVGREAGDTGAGDTIGGAEGDRAAIIRHIQ